MKNLRYEKTHGYPQVLVAGCDEVGRGCLAGPVVSAAVILPDFDTAHAPVWLSRVTDSKALSPSSRSELSLVLKSWVKHYAIAEVSAEEIDVINIHYASLLSMKKAIDSLGVEPGFILVDGKWKIPGVSIPQRPIIQGDKECLSISCASILAKVYRDELMNGYDASYPQYGFSRHKGYPTKVHVDALSANGITHFHRKSFEPVKNVLEKTDKR